MSPFQHSWGQRILKGLLLPLVLLAVGLCSERAMSVFFDVPPPSPEEIAAKAEAKARADALIAAARAGVDISTAQKAADGNPEIVKAAETPPPEIESTKTWDDALPYLPLDKEGRRGRPDWTEAARQGIIKPRGSVDGTANDAHQEFKYDFFIPSDEEGFEAYFPHSTHTEWIACESCHPKIFPVRGAKMTKDDIKDGKYCGVCHKQSDDGPAFWLRACDRCHLLAKD